MSKCVEKYFNMPKTIHSRERNAVYNVYKYLRDQKCAGCESIPLKLASELTAPHEWFITRNMWLAESYTKVPIEKHFEPLRLVIIQHTVSTVCYRFVKCATEMRNLQTYFIHHKDRDIPYNFLVGNDGRIYEGRGWQAEGAHTKPYNRCSVGIGFVGDYRSHEGDIKVTAAQENRTHLLLAEGVRLGYLHPDYLVSGAKDLGDTVSPGANLYSVIQQWEHYDHTSRFRNKTCEVINEMPFDKKIH